jgi:hypothetical protein
MSLTFTLNHKANYQGLSSHFPFRSVLSSTFIIILSQSSFSHNLGVRSFCLRVASPYHAYLHPKLKPPVTVYVTLKNILVTFLRTFGRGRPPTIAPRSINLFLCSKFRLRRERRPLDKVPKKHLPFARIAKDTDM